jgi:hypothetical protein
MLRHALRMTTAISVLLLPIVNRPAHSEDGKYNRQTSEPTYTYTIWILYPRMAVTKGEVHEEKFINYFQRDYVAVGDKISPPDGSVFDGLLIASDGQNAIVLPIVHWQTKTDKLFYLCQGTTKFGKAPMFVAVAYGQDGIVKRITEKLSKPH